MEDVDRELVEKVANLARFVLRDEEIEALTKHFKRVLDYVRQLDELPEVEGDVVSGFVSSAPMRDDVEGEPLDRIEALGNAPHTNGEYILVPKIIKREE